MHPNSCILVSTYLTNDYIEQYLRNTAGNQTDGINPSVIYGMQKKVFVQQ